MIHSAVGLRRGMHGDMIDEIIKIIQERISEELPAFIIKQKQDIIVDQKRRGEWPDLTPAYAERKLKQYGFTYPMLQRTGDLAEAFQVDIIESPTGLSVSLSNSVEYFDYVNNLRNILDYTEEDFDDILDFINEIAADAIAEKYGQ